MSHEFVSHEDRVRENEKREVERARHEIQSLNSFIEKLRTERDSSLVDAGDMLRTIDKLVKDTQAGRKKHDSAVSNDG